MLLHLPGHLFGYAYNVERVTINLQYQSVPLDIMILQLPPESDFRLFV